MTKDNGRRIVIPGAARGGGGLHDLAGMKMPQRVEFVLARLQRLELALANHGKVLEQAVGTMRELSRMSHWIAAHSDAMVSAGVATGDEILELVAGHTRDTQAAMVESRDGSALRVTPSLQTLKDQGPAAPE